MKIDRINGSHLNKAIAVYLEYAWRDKIEAAPRPPRFPAEKPLAEILASGGAFEDLSDRMEAGTLVPTGAGTQPRAYALTLGNLSYPSMKLALLEVYFPDEFVFAVDRHDTFHFEPEVPGYEAWRQLKEINRLLKESIEEAWYKEGLPTLRGLREAYINRKEQPRDLGTGSTLLVLDDDRDRAEMLKEILEAESYQVLVGPPGPRPDPSNSEIRAAMEAQKGHSLRLPAVLVDGAEDVEDLCELIQQHQTALIILDVSYRTGQGPLVASALRMEAESQEVPILGIYSRRDFGPDPDLFNASLRRPYRSEALLSIISQTILAKSPSGLHSAIKPPEGSD
jgi:CheY-like chemotaxis protein